MLARACDRPGEQLGDAGRAQVRRAAIARAPKRRMVRHGPSTASGGTTTLTRDPSGSRASASGALPVGAQPERADDPLDQQLDLVAARGGASVTRAGRARSTQTGAGAVDHHLGDRRVGEQRLERAEARGARARRRRRPRRRRPRRGAGGCGGPRRRPSSRSATRVGIDCRAARRGRVGDRRRGRVRRHGAAPGRGPAGSREASRPASTARATAGSSSTTATTGTPRQVSTSWRVSDRPGSATSTTSDGRSGAVERPAQRQEAGPGDQDRSVGRRRRRCGRRPPARCRSRRRPRRGSAASSAPSTSPRPAAAARRRGGAGATPGATGYLEAPERVGGDVVAGGEPPGQPRTVGLGQAEDGGQSPARSARSAPPPLAVGAARGRARRRRRWCRRRPWTTSRR